jgi:hypothetical protein
VYVAPDSDAEAYVREHFPHKTIRHARRSVSPDDPYNDSDQPITVRSVSSPGPVSLLGHSRTLGQAIRDGKANAQQELPLPHLLLMLAQPGSVTFAAGLPVGLQRQVLLPLVAAVVRRMGYRPAAGLRSRAGRR